MIPERLHLPLMGFVSKAEDIPNLKAVVLFGSAVKGDFDKKSDIDLLLLFDTDHNPEAGAEAEVAHKVASEVLSKYDLPHSFAFVMENVNDPRLDLQFLRSVISDGIMIWAHPELKMLKEPRPNMEPRSIFSYSLSALTPKDKMAVHRSLYGYRVVRVIKGKRYVNAAKGIVKGKEKIGDGVFMVPSRTSQDVIELFTKFGVSYKRVDVWI